MTRTFKETLLEAGLGKLAAACLDKPGDYGSDIVTAKVNNLTGVISVTAEGGTTPLAMANAAIEVAHLTISKTALNTDAPELRFVAKDGAWITGVDVANHGGGCDYVLAGRVNTNATVDDVIYLNYNNGLTDPVTIGYAFTPPPNLNYRHWFAAADTLNTMGGAAFRVGPSQTAHAISVIDSSAVDRFYVCKDFSLSGPSGVVIKKGAGAPVFTMTDASLGAQYGFQYNGSALEFRYQTGGIPLQRYQTDGRVDVLYRIAIGSPTDDGVSSVQTNGNIAVANAGYGYRTKEGANAKQGVATLVAGSSVVANTSVTATSRIFLTSQADGGTPGFLRVSTRAIGTSFTITSSSGSDTSTVAYEIFQPA